MAAAIHFYRHLHIALFGASLYERTHVDDVGHDHRRALAR
jgi:hypothetical protein